MKIIQGGCKSIIMIKKRVTDELVFLVKTAVAFGLGFLFTFGASRVLGELLEKKELDMLLNQQELPKATLELIGMQKLQQFPAEVEVFFLISMVSNLAIMGVIFAHSVHTMRQSVGQGSAGLLLLQVTKKRIYFVAECIRILLAAWLTWGIYMMGMFLAGGFLAKGVDISISSKVVDILSTMTVWGVVVALLVASISVLYGIKQQYRMHGFDFGLVLMGISFVIGNAYKIPQYIGQKQVEQMVNAQQTMEVMRTMKSFRWANPLSWLNPFNIYNKVLDVEMLWSYAGVAVLVFAVAGAVFCVRDWWEV